MKTRLLFWGLVFTSVLTHAQTTSVPDDNFENYLETHDAAGTVVPLGDPTSMGDGIANNDLVLTLRINTVTSLNNLAYINIADLTGIEDFAALQLLNCAGNLLTSLNISQNTMLNTLYCYENQLTVLDVSQNTALGILDCMDNKLTTLDLSQNVSLTSLWTGDWGSGFNNNQITDLDLSQNVNLVELIVTYMDSLLTLNIQNSFTNNINNYSTLGTPNLSCIKVDDVSYANTNFTNKTPLNYFSLTCTETTYVPDDNFENYLETHDRNGAIVTLGSVNGMGDGIANNDLVLTAKINSVTNLSIPSLNIADLTGIQDFTNLTDLTANNNQVTTLDISQNLNLKKLWFWDNQLSTIDVSLNVILQDLDIDRNNISSLDVTNNTALVYLWFAGNPLITNIDTSNNTLLQHFVSYDNNFTSYNLDHLPNLTWVDLKRNPNLTSLSVKNGSNLTLSLETLGSTNLACIEVDDVAVAYNKVAGGQWKKEASTSFELDCDNPSDKTYIVDANFENYLETHKSNGVVVSVGDPSSMGDGITNNNLVFTNRIDVATELDVSNLTIASLIGIEGFAALITLKCTDNSLTALDVSSNILLENLEVYNNQITNINVTQNTVLKTLYIWNNLLSNINVTQNVLLENLAVDDNQLTGIDISQNTVLKYLGYSNWDNTAPFNTITNLDLSNNPNLETLDLLRVDIADLDVTTNLNLKSINNSFNQSLTAINLTNNTLLENLDLKNCALTAINVTSNLNLKYLLLNNNSNITGLLDLSGHNQLLTLLLEGLNLQELDLKSGNTNGITGYNSTNNPLLTCVQVDDVTYANTIFTDKDAATNFNTDCNFVLSTEDNVYLKETLRVYPNPTSGFVNIQTPYDVIIKEVIVFNTLGEKVKTIYNNNTVDVSTLNSGIYFININTNKGNITQQINKL